MKNALIIALALATTVSFAADKAATKEAKAACKAEGKKGKEFKACVKEKTAAPAAATTPAPTK